MICVKQKKRCTKKTVHKAFGKTCLLLLLVITFSYWIRYTEWYAPKINELSASYISLNNNNTTDMLKITNLKKLSDRKGKGMNNPCKQKFEVTGEEHSSYRIVLYHLGNGLEDEYVHYYLTSNQGVEVKGTLSDALESYDGGKIIKMWVAKDYIGEVNNIAYEIRIKEAGETYER